MALIYFAGQRITGLSTDTKPTIADGWTFTEADTQRELIRHGGVWVDLGVETSAAPCLSENSIKE